MIKIAVIGAGYMAHEHIKAFQAVGGATIAGVMGRSPTNVKNICEEFGILAQAKSVSELYEKTRADALLVAVNEAASPRLLNEALDYPWVILAEKPISLKIADAKQIEQKRAMLNRQVFVAMNRRHYASTRQSQRLLESDDNPRIIEIHDQENIIAATEGGTPSEVISSWMVANSIHLIDYFNIFCRGKLSHIHINAELDVDNPFFSQAFIEYDSGDKGVYTAFWNAPGPWSVKITTKKQLLEMRPLEKLERQIFPQRQRHLVDLPEDDQHHKPGLFIQASGLVAAVQSINHFLPSLQDYLTTHELVNKLYPSKIRV
jgi:predicted dehydrogenase